mmetsp:Transcript_7276/g.16620  ORF Transcript_7276/g.16620 Transcript_7276/m.16620 type:complete len:268 (+) Transcript_7276:10455-11258(+)
MVDAGCVGAVLGHLLLRLLDRHGADPDGVGDGLGVAQALPPVAPFVLCDGRQHGRGPGPARRRRSSRGRRLRAQRGHRARRRRGGAAGGHAHRAAGARRAAGRDRGGRPPSAAAAAQRHLVAAAVARRRRDPRLCGPLAARAERCHPRRLPPRAGAHRQERLGPAVARQGVAGADLPHPPARCRPVRADPQRGARDCARLHQGHGGQGQAGSLQSAGVGAADAAFAAAAGWPNGSGPSLREPGGLQRRGPARRRSAVADSAVLRLPG